MRRLLLDNNKLQDAGAKSLSLALPHLQIEELNISFNEIGSPGLTSIIQCIQSSRTVKSLWLSGNVIDNDVAKILATMLLKNTILQVLYMDHCSITTVGERFIGTGIASNKKCVLNVLTGFELAKVLVLLGSPAQIGELSNDSALKYLHQMWLHVERNNLSPTNPGNNTAVSSSPASSVQSNDIPIVHQQPSPRHESLHPVGPGTGGNSQHHVHYASDVPTPPVNPNPTNVDGDTGAVPPPINDDDYDGENSMGSDYDDDIDDDSYSDESYVSNSDRSDTSSHFDHRYDQYYTYNYPKPVEPTLANEGMHPNIANSAVAQEVSRADLDAIASAMPPITPREDQSQLPHTNSGGRGRARSRTQSGHANSGERLRSISRSQSRGNISEGEDVVRLRTYIVNPEVVVSILFNNF